MRVALYGFLLIKIFSHDEFADLHMGTIPHYVGPAAPAMAGKDSPLLDQEPRALKGEPFLGIGHPSEVEVTVRYNPIKGLLKWRSRRHRSSVFYPYPLPLSRPATPIESNPVA